MKLKDALLDLIPTEYYDEREGIPILKGFIMYEWEDWSAKQAF